MTGNNIEQSCGKLMDNYLDLSRPGRNEWWRYLIGAILILAFWQIVGAIPSVLLIMWVMLDGNQFTALMMDGSFSGVNINIIFLTLMMASWAFLGGIFLTIRFIHQRRFLSLITTDRRINWKRLIQAFLVWFILAAGAGLIEAVIFPGRYVFTFDPKYFLPFVFIALLCLPIQTSAEELFFRGYLLQGIGLRIRNIWILSMISGVVFMLPHLLNPEAKANTILMGFYYFSIGATMAFVTLRDGGLELALGVHMANNIFAGVFANAVVTVMPTPSLFTIMKLDVHYAVIASTISLLIFILFFLGPLKKCREKDSYIG